LQWNFLPLNKAQPFFVLHGGYMYSTRAIPTSDAGSFNFTLDFGAGIELYRSKTRSIRAEYRYHHISNKDTSRANPGIDNGLFQATYSFGNSYRGTDGSTSADHASMPPRRDCACSNP
jgi:opacity protein-like surface antigen